MDLRMVKPLQVSIRFGFIAWLVGMAVFAGGCSSTMEKPPRVGEEVFSAEGELHGFSGGGQYVVAITDISRKVGIWETATGLLLPAYEYAWGGQEPTFNPLDTTLVISQAGSPEIHRGPISIRSALTGYETSDFEWAAYYPALHPVFSADGKRIYALDSDGSVLRIDETAFQAPELGGVTVAVISTDYTGNVWEGQTSFGLLDLGVAVTDVNPRYKLTAISSEYVLENCLYTDGSTAVRIRTDTALTILDLETGAQINQASFQGQPPPKCPDRKEAEVTLKIDWGSSPQLHQWITQGFLGLPGTSIPGLTVSHLADLLTDQDQIDYQNAITMNADNAHLFVSSDEKYLLVRIDKDVWVWDLTESALVRRLKIRAPLVPTPDGLAYLYSKDDNTLGLVDTLTGEEKILVTGDFGPTVFDAAFSPNGKLLATAGYNYHGVIIWNLETGREIYRIPTQWLTDRVFFSANGKWLAFGDIFDFHVWEIKNNP